MERNYVKQVQQRLFERSRKAVVMTETILYEIRNSSIPKRCIREWAPANRKGGELNRRFKVRDIRRSYCHDHS